jgi:hypothetical protein
MDTAPAMDTRPANARVFRLKVGAAIFFSFVILQN